MTADDFRLVLFYFSGIMLAALGLGFLIYDFFDKKIPDQSAEKIGAALLIGLGSLGYLGLILGAFRQFNKNALFAVGIAIFLISAKRLIVLAKNLFSHHRQIVTNLVKNPAGALMIGLTIVLVWFLYLSAMRPPIHADELAYHFPQANLIIEKSTVPFNLDVGQHYFYGNIPKLMEVILAIGTLLHSYSLAHALHIGFLVAFLIFIAGTLSRYYNLKTAGLAVLLIVLYEELAGNAVSGYVDTATVSLEIGALLLSFDWFISKKPASLSIAGILIGLALSIKYSAAATLIFILIIGAIGILIKKQSIKTLLPFGGLALLFGGYWYIKNLILYQNPFYPLYFGHQGVNEQQYQSLIASVQQFSGRTWQGFLNIPKRFLVIADLPVYFSFYLAPLVLLIRKNWQFHGLIVLYLIFYLPYWYFFATHQVRFLMPAIVAILIATSIFLSNLKTKQTILILGLLLLALQPFISQQNWQTFLSTKKRVVDRRYGLGEETKLEFLTRQFGCYAIVDTMERKNWQGAVIDNWTVWHAPSLSFYSPQNRFLRFTFDINNSTYDLIKDLRNEDIQFVYFNSGIKAQFLETSDPEILGYLRGRDVAEQFLLDRSELIYEYGVCKLYKIDFERLEKDWHTHQASL